MLISGRGDGSLRVSLKPSAWRPASDSSKASSIPTSPNADDSVASSAPSRRTPETSASASTKTPPSSSKTIRASASWAPARFISSTAAASHSPASPKKNPGGVLCVYDLKLHVLGEGDSFDLNTRRPKQGPEPDDA
jgi:hypothetical protein